METPALSLAETLERNIRDILTHAFEPFVPERALVVFDSQTRMSRAVTDAYRVLIPQATFLDFDEVGSVGVRAAWAKLSKGDLVVLNQSGNFRIDEFRIRIELFRLGFKVIEHVHLCRILPSEEMVYAESLAYDPAYYRVVGPALKDRLEKVKKVVVYGPDGAELVYDSPMEMPKLNIGDYRYMDNIGGTYPIGEVFTEARDLSKVNGDVVLWGFGGMDFNVRIAPKPFRVHVKNGVLTADDDAPEEFLRILAKVAADEQILVRELGLGLNKAFSKDRVVSDITAFERQYGMHMSLGEKHPVYKKEGIQTKKTRHHVDVFVALERIEADGVALYENGAFVV